ncbi:hypothetical protein [Mesonia mobilis]|uniref:hypothetical protein n=1 Tax=Mesonia mobilis TaxID=369791 RepID=UPI0024B91858|nr:hypothetical protein [Mesonia mobilis]
MNKLLLINGALCSVMVVRYGASFRLYFRQQIWATNPYLRQQIYNKFNQKRANKQQIKEDKIL